jgi:hypothetical protein
VPITTYVAAIGASWWSIAGQLLTSAVILVSVRQDLGLRTRVGAAFGIFIALAFGISALLTAISVKLRSGVAICAVIVGFEFFFILRWILRRQKSKGKSQ